VTGLPQRAARVPPAALLHAPPARPAQWPLAAIAASAVLALLACRERVEPAASVSGAGGAPPSPPARVTTAQPLYAGASVSFAELVAAARHGVVAIRAATPVRSGPAAMYPGVPNTAADVALGTGFLVETRGVYVLTTDRIAAAAAELRVVLADGAELPARLVGRDVRLDLALLAVDAPRLRGLPLGDSDAIATGEWLLVLGNAFGDEVTAAAGILAATGREAAGSLVPGSALGLRTFLQTDARVHRGNSGGPVLDTAGQVVGMAVATGDRPTELSFAIPINRVKEVLDALRERGAVARSWLGVLVRPVTAELAQQLGLAAPAGALVTEVKAGSPAARGALRPGDVVLRWGERVVDHRSLPWIVAQAPVGRPIELVVWRDRTETRLSVVTEQMPE
jgi:serine protease Do